MKKATATELLRDTLSAVEQHEVRVAQLKAEADSFAAKASLALTDVEIARAAALSAGLALAQRQADRVIDLIDSGIVEAQIKERELLTSVLQLQSKLDAKLTARVLEDVPEDLREGIDVTRSKIVQAELKARLNAGTVTTNSAMGNVRVSIASAKAVLSNLENLAAELTRLERKLAA